MNLHPDDFAEMVVTTIARTVRGPLIQDRFESIESRLTALEARPLPMYRGAHQDGKGYPANSLVTHAGSLWLSMMSTTSAPGTDPSWQLAVKKGDAR